MAGRRQSMHEPGQVFHYPYRWRLAGIPMPKALLPTGSTFETEADGRFAFDIDIALPLIGRIVAYRGTLRPV